ncbi:MAG: hypothetical protein RRB22_03435 [Gammaproteobacteria bacterium]|nr:hypothetical protein [Gammaproteobacteria bacterium]
MDSDHTIIHIGNYPIKVWHNDPLVDGYEYYGELSTGQRTPKEYRCNLSYFSGVSCIDLPDRLHLWITHNGSEFKRVNFVRITKLSNQCKLVITLNIDYARWELEESVSSFVFRFVDFIKNELNVEITADKTDVGYCIDVPFYGSKVDDIYNWYSTCEHTVEKFYQKCLVSPTGNNSESVKYGEDRLHWWVRYVFVPLIGSGTIAAVLAKYIFQ